MDMTETMKLYQQGLEDGSSGEFCAFVPPHLHLARLKRAAQLIATTKAQTVLDVGCGIGMLVPHLSEGTDYLGIDIVPELIEKAREHYPERRFSVADPVQVLGQYDLVCCLGVLSHIPAGDLYEFLSSLATPAKRWLLIEAHDPYKYTGAFHAHSPSHVGGYLMRLAGAKHCTVHCHADDSAYQLLVEF